LYQVNNFVFLGDLNVIKSRRLKEAYIN